MKAAVERAAAEYAAEAAKFQPSKEAGQEAGAESKKQKKKRNKHKKAAQDSSGPAAEQKVTHSDALTISAQTHRHCSDTHALLRHTDTAQTQTHCSDTQTLLRQTSRELVLMTVLISSAMMAKQVDPVMHQTQLYTDKLCRCLNSNLLFILSCLFQWMLFLSMCTPESSLQTSYCH